MSDTKRRVVCSPQEAAALFGLHPATIRKMIRDGKLKAITAGNRGRVSLFSLAEAMGTNIESLRERLPDVRRHLASVQQQCEDTALESATGGGRNSYPLVETSGGRSNEAIQQWRERSSDNARADR